MKHYEPMLKSLGYVGLEHYFEKHTASTVHQIVLFKKDLRMYGFAIGHSDELEYDTGFIVPTSNELETLIRIFTTNHN